MASIAHLSSKFSSCEKMVKKLKKSTGGDQKLTNRLISTKLAEMESLAMLLPNDQGALLALWIEKIEALKASESRQQRSPVTTRRRNRSPGTSRRRSRSPVTARRRSRSPSRAPLASHHPQIVFTSRTFYGQPKPSFRRSSPEWKPAETRCHWCKEPGHWASNCPELANKKCYVCDYYGHISTYCNHK